MIVTLKFQWIPEPPPSVAKKKKKKAKSGKKSLLSGFGPKLPSPDPVEVEVGGAVNRGFVSQGYEGRVSL